MKTRTLAALGAAAGLMAVIGSPAMAGTAPGSGFAGASHDETSYEGTNITTGACVSCHTPHQAKTTNLLWNHTLSSSTFSWAGATATTAGTPYATFQGGGVAGTGYAGMSAKCLSCHDGTLSTSTGQWFQATLQPVGTSFIGQTPLTSPWAVIGGYNLGGPGQTNVRPASGTGANGAGHMEGTHPLAMPYPYLQARNTYNSVETGPGYIPTDWVSDPTPSGIRLYNNPDGVGTNISAGTLAGFTGMECGSCHDVHNGPTVQDTYLVRGKLTGTALPPYLCSKCHAK